MASAFFWTVGAHDLDAIGDQAGHHGAFIVQMTPNNPLVSVTVDLAGGFLSAGQASCANVAMIGKPFEASEYQFVVWPVIKVKPMGMDGQRGQVETVIIIAKIGRTAD